MKRIFFVWKRQDLINQLLLVAGFTICIASIFAKRAEIGLFFMVIVCLIAVARNNTLRKQMSRRYGALFFHMPDGEIYPMTFEQVKAEYIHGQQGKYNGRKITVRFRYFGLDENGDIDTGFGLAIRVDPMTIHGYKKGDLLLVIGTINAINRQYFVVDQVEEIRLTTDKEDLTVAPGLATEDHTKQEEN